MTQQVESPFHPGFIFITPGAKEAFRRAGITPGAVIHRHLVGDWGDVTEDDHQANEQALEDGGRLMSVYRLGTGEVLWIITEAVCDEGFRVSSCVLLPEEY